MGLPGDAAPNVNGEGEVGEAPGADEDEEGFSGVEKAIGALLKKLEAETGTVSFFSPFSSFSSFTVLLSLSFSFSLSLSSDASPPNKLLANTDGAFVDPNTIPVVFFPESLPNLNPPAPEDAPNGEGAPGNTGLLAAGAGNDALSDADDAPGPNVSVAGIGNAGLNPPAGLGEEPVDEDAVRLPNPLKLDGAAGMVNAGFEFVSPGAEVLPKLKEALATGAGAGAAAGVGVTGVGADDAFLMLSSSSFCAASRNDLYRSNMPDTSANGSESMALETVAMNDTFRPRRAA